MNVRLKLCFSFWGVFWIDANSQSSIEEGFEHIGKICGIVGKTDMVKRGLSNLTHSWLLIMDNADNVDLDLSKYFPIGSRGTLLITTRNPAVRRNATVGSYELSAMDVDDAVALFFKASGIAEEEILANRESAQNLVEKKLGCLALAISQAGASIFQGSYTLAEYGDIFSRNRKELLEERNDNVQGQSDYKYTVYTTWNISIKALMQKNTVGALDAIQLLNVFGFFHYEGISEEIFSKASNLSQMIQETDKDPSRASTYSIKIITDLCQGRRSRSPQSLRRYEEQYIDWYKRHQLRVLHKARSQDHSTKRYREATRMLLSYSLITGDRNGLISMHPLVHSWIRDSLDKETQMWTCNAAMSILPASISWAPSTDDYRHRRSLSSHIQICVERYDDCILQNMVSEPAACGAILAFCFFFYFEIERTRKENQILEQALEAQKKQFEVEHPVKFGSMYDPAIE